MKLIPNSSARQGVALLMMVAALAGCGGVAPTPVIVFVSATPAEPTPTPTATVSAPPTATPAATSTPSPSPSLTSASASCTGTAENKAFFLEAATKLSFDVYCAVLPSGWWVDSGSYSLPDGGYMEAEYKHASGAAFEIREGRWCPPYKACVAHGPTIGPASFDGLAGTLHLNSGTYTLEVGTYANPAYLMVGHGMTQAQFMAWAAAMFKVPKP